VVAERERKALDSAALGLLGLYEQEQHPHVLNEVDQLSKGGALSPGVLGVAALSLTAVDRYAEAVTAAGEAIRREPGWAWLYAALAVAEAGQGALQAAVEAQRQAVRLMPGEPAYGASLARYERLRGHPDLAARTARQALMVDGGHPDALNELGLALLALGNPTAALDQFRNVQAAAPDQPAGFLGEGLLHLGAGARREARRALREALRRKPGLIEAENRMAETIAGTRGPGRAAILHLLMLGRVTLVGWLIVAFVYYLLFRLLEFIWRIAPATQPFSRGLLLATLAYLLVGLGIGTLLRFLFRKGWPA
jgi:tetratricopeptide (TPR) repeat protein